MPIEDISACVNAHILKLVHEQSPVILFHKAAALLSYSYDAAYVARKRGQFPVRVRTRGGTLVVFTSDLIVYLQTGESQAELSVPLLQRIHTARTGRPSKRESMEAEKLGLSVKDMRAAMSRKLGGNLA